MQFRQALVTTILLAFSAGALSQRAASGEECFAQGGNVDARECLLTKARKSESALAQGERDAVRSLEQSDEDAKVRQHAVAAFQAAAVAYRRYRQAQCGFQLALAVNGTGAPHRRLLCEIALNEERISHMGSVRGLGQ